MQNRRQINTGKHHKDQKKTEEEEEKSKIIPKDCPEANILWNNFQLIPR